MAASLVFAYAEVFMNTRLILILYFLFINFIGIAAMAADKIRSMEYRFRAPESVLITIAVIGGSIGCILGMFLFRHKTRKPKFRIGLPAILAVQVLLWIIVHIATSEIIYL